jgi:hypothetical protein
MKNLILTGILLMTCSVATADVIHLETDRKENTAKFISEISVHVLAQEFADLKNEQLFDEVIDIGIELCEEKLAEKKLALDTFNTTDTKILETWEDRMGNRITDRPLVQTSVECVGMEMDTVHMDVVDQD